MGRLRIWNETRQTLLAEHAAIAGTSGGRRTGLLKHQTFEPGDGLWIAPCEAVHTIGMKFAIDVVFLDRRKRILKIRESLPKWRVTGCLRAHSVLELPAGICRAASAGVGDQLHFERLSENVGNGPP